MSHSRRLIAAILFAAALPVFAQDEAANPGAEAPSAEEAPKLVLRDLLVIQADRYDDVANNPKLNKTVLPAVISKRGRDKQTDDQNQYQHKPMPVGVLTFQGKIKEPMKLTVRAVSPNSTIQAHWPKDAMIGKDNVSWLSVREADPKQRAVPFGAQGDWLAELRDSEDRLWLQSRDKLRKERFVLYDTSFKFKPAIELADKDGQYLLKTSAPEQAAPPLTLLLRKGEAGWTGEALSAPWGGPSPAIAEKDSSAPATSDLREALKPIIELLQKRGYTPQEIELAVGMIGAAGFDKSDMSLAYVLPVGVIDEHVQLIANPMPDQVIRTAIVVVANVDPGLGSQVQALIADLGSDQWIKRDRAQRKLIDLGQAAIKQVRPLKDSKDPEVAFRARQILDTYNWNVNGGK